MKSVEIHCQRLLENELIGKRVNTSYDGNGEIIGIRLVRDEPVFVKLDDGRTKNYSFSPLTFIGPTEEEKLAATIKELGVLGYEVEKEKEREDVYDVFLKGNYLYTTSKQGLTNILTTIRGN